MSSSGTLDTSEVLAAHDAAWEALGAGGIIDGHNDLMWELRSQTGSAVAGLDQIDDRFHTDLVRLRAGGVVGQFWSVWLPSWLSDTAAVTAALEQIDLVHRLAQAYPERLVFARTAAEVRAAAKSGRIACLIGLEGGHLVGRSPAVLRMFARLGARYLTLTHTENNAWADAATDRPAVGGLSDEGLAMVAECERQGVLVDLSHVAPTTMRAALAVAKAPVIFSHSSALALTDHPRNVPDDVLAQLPANGGVAMASFVPEFVSQAFRDWQLESEAALSQMGVVFRFGESWMPAPRAGETPEQTITRGLAERQARRASATAAGQARSEAATGRGDTATADAAIADATATISFTDALEAYQAAHPAPPVTIKNVADHIEHMREVAGIDHIGIGSDFDGTAMLPQGLEDVASYPRLFMELARRGWSVDNMAALAGRNILRVLAATDPVSPPPDEPPPDLPGDWIDQAAKDIWGLDQG
ncbi:MAG: dipeptidase [Bifidobacteriaceae bacterium]|nr:dipeptidase [Bifidobacteriaceae bacterium]